MKLKHHYFCSFPYRFDRGCQIIPYREGDKLYAQAEAWAKTNGYKNVYVYTMSHDFVWSFHYE